VHGYASAVHKPVHKDYVNAYESFKMTNNSEPSFKKMFCEDAKELQMSSRVKMFLLRNSL